AHDLAFLVSGGGEHPDPVSVDVNRGPPLAPANRSRHRIGVPWTPVAGGPPAIPLQVEDTGVHECSPPLSLGIRWPALNRSTGACNREPLGTRSGRAWIGQRFPLARGEAAQLGRRNQSAAPAARRRRTKIASRGAGGAPEPGRWTEAAEGKPV